MLLKAINGRNGRPLALHVRVASSFWRRGVGLLGTRTLPRGEGLWIAPCQSVHTFFMRYPIDLVFLDRANMVIYAKTLPPWRASAWNAQALGVLELPAGVLSETDTRVGDEIVMREP